MLGSIANKAQETQKTQIDNENEDIYTFVKAIAAQAALLALQQVSGLHLDNSILESMPQEGDITVARLKERVQLDDGTVRWATADNKQDLFRNIARI